MAKDNAIASSGIGMAIGSRKLYYRSDLDQPIAISPNNAVKKTNQQLGLKRQQI